MGAALTFISYIRFPICRLGYGSGTYRSRDVICRVQSCQCDWSSGAGRSKQTWRSEVTSSENLKKTHSLGWWTQNTNTHGMYFRPGGGGGDNEPGFLVFSLLLFVDKLLECTVKKLRF